MKATKTLTVAEIGDRIRRRQNFNVATENERKTVLIGAKFGGADVMTRANPAGGFDVFFVQPVRKHTKTKE